MTYLDSVGDVPAIRHTVAGVYCVNEMRHKPALAPPPAAPASFWPGPGGPFARKPSPFPGRCGWRGHREGGRRWCRLLGPSSRWSWASGLPAVEEVCYWQEHHCWLCCWSESPSSWSLQDVKLPGPAGTSAVWAQLLSVMSFRNTSGEDNTDLRGLRDKWWRRAGVPLHLFARRFL